MLRSLMGSYMRTNNNTQTDTDRNRQTQTDTDRHRQTETDTDRHRQTQTDTHTDIFSSWRAYRGTCNHHDPSNET